jgi:hypothetical protein
MEIYRVGRIKTTIIGLVDDYYRFGVTLRPMTKHPGGRGRKAPNKHETITISLPPHLKALLDAWTTSELSRSGVVGELIQSRADAMAGAVVIVTSAELVTQKPDVALAAARVGKSAAPTSASPSRPSEKPKRTRPESGKTGQTERLALRVAALRVASPKVPRGLGWKPEKYAAAEALLAQGDTLTAEGVNWRTVEGELMLWRTAEALAGLGVLVPA